jgi:nucleoporin NDC1
VRGCYSAVGKLSCQPSMAVQARVRFYREFLTPALHRRFVRAAGLVLILCYVESILIGSSSSCKLSLTEAYSANISPVLWSWFPLGWAGMRALLLFIPSLLVFILRLAQLHLGPRMTNSPLESFRQYALHLNTLQTVIFYCCSALLFGEVFMWSAPPEAELSLVLEGRQVLHLRNFNIASLLTEIK